MRFFLLFSKIYYIIQEMSEDEEFQYVVSRQDYNHLKSSKAKLQNLMKKLSETESLHSEQGKTFISKIQRLEDELKIYRTSIRQHVDRQIKEIDELIKILKDYRFSQTHSSLDILSLNRIKSECDKISQTFNVSLKSLQLINSEVMNVVKSLVQDSLDLNGKLKEYTEMYENAQLYNENLLAEIKKLAEKSLSWDRDKQKLLKSQQRLIYQNEVLKQNLKEKENQNSQLQISFQNFKNKTFQEIKTLNQQKRHIDLKWREILENSENQLEREIMDLKNEQLISTKATVQQIQNLKQILRFKTEESAKKQNQIQMLQVAYQEQLDRCQQFNHRITEKQQSLKQMEENFRNQSQISIQNYQKQLEYLRSSYQQKSQAQSKIIDDLERVMNQQHQSKKVAQNQFKQKQKRLQKQIQDIRISYKLEKEILEKIIHQSREQLIQIAKKLEETEETLKLYNEIQKQWQEKFQSQEKIIQNLKKNFFIQQQKYLDLESKLSQKNEQIKKIKLQNANLKNLSQQIDQMRKVMAICESEKTILEEKTSILQQQLHRLKKIDHDSMMKLNKQNEQLMIQLRTTMDNLQKKKKQSDQAFTSLNQTKIMKSKLEAHYSQLHQAFEKEKKQNKELINHLNNQMFVLQQSLTQKQILQEYLLNQIQNLRFQAKSLNQEREATNLLKMDVQTLKTELQTLTKQKFSIKKQNQSLTQELNHTKLQVQQTRYDLNGMKLYIEEIQQNLEKLLQEKAILQNQFHLLKQEAKFCKHENIQQLGFIDHLERQLQTAKKQLKTLNESINQLKNVKRSSLSKGEKSYYVKEMIQEYRDQMRKNLQEIGALTPDEIRDLLVYELRELGNYVKSLQNGFY